MELRFYWDLIIRIVYFLGYFLIIKIIYFLCMLFSIIIFIFE